VAVAISTDKFNAVRERWNKVMNETEDLILQLSPNGIDNSDPVFKKGQYVSILSSPSRLDTLIESVKWDDKNHCWKYYFSDENGKTYYETEEAIVNKKS
jgi:hypothetical protein